MVDERWKRIPSPWLWALAGAALVGVFVFVFAVAPSLLIRHPNGLSAADELKARNDVRATLVQALAGLAVAGGLIVTYRTYRQNRAEQDRTYERELYAKAVEQLGHEKAPVRLGALYSLERLAQDKPKRRQTVVDVICAYLRMPFSPTAPANRLEPAATEDAGAPDTAARLWTKQTGDTWWQESQVRRTAQRILAEHLRDDRAEDKRSTEPSSPRLWPGIRVDLAGATLIDFDLSGGVMAGADFGRATFSGVARFNAAIFSGDAGFHRATFSGPARFNAVTFSGDVGFDGATFSAKAWFSRATFSGTAGFQAAIFSDDAWFGGATFSGDAWFGGATFSGTAGFNTATFHGTVRFGRAMFSRDEDGLSFGGSVVTLPDAEHIWPAGWRLGPDGSGGYTVVRENDAGRS